MHLGKLEYSWLHASIEWALLFSAPFTCMHTPTNDWLWLIRRQSRSRPLSQSKDYLWMWIHPIHCVPASSSDRSHFWLIHAFTRLQTYPDSWIVKCYGTWDTHLFSIVRFLIIFWQRLNVWCWTKFFFKDPWTFSPISNTITPPLRRAGNRRYEIYGWLDWNRRATT